MALASFSYEVTTLDNAEDALTVVCETMPDMIIFDIMLPGMSGPETNPLIMKSTR